jgi:hypothetical protein
MAAQNHLPEETNVMKHAIRISALAFIVAAAFAGNPHANNTAIASNTYSSVPGGGGPMPICNPFKEVCPTIR